MCCRGLLRRLLGAYLNVEPGEVRFATGPAGKPELEDLAHSRLHFNVTHSHGLALYAVAHDILVLQKYVAEVHAEPDETATSLIPISSDSPST